MQETTMIYEFMTVMQNGVGVGLTDVSVFNFY